MLARTWILLRARLAAQRDGAKLPIASLFMQAFASAVLCALAPRDLPAFAYALFALAVALFLVAIPLLGELGDLLVRDEADAWVSALPVRPAELRLARLVHLCIVLGFLTLGALLPAALMAHGYSLAARLGLVALGLGQSIFVAAFLVAAMGALSGRAQSLLVLLQAGLFLGAIVGGSLGLRHLEILRAFESPGAHGLGYLPPAWFAAPLAAGPVGLPWSCAALGVCLASILVLALVPAPRLVQTRKGQLLLGRILAPLRWLALRSWVRPGERGVFEWVFDALPKEREFVLRTYPLIGLPLAFLLVGARGEAPGESRALLSLLLFTPGVYLPLLLVHVPVSASFRARWILDGAPLHKQQIDDAAIKAVAVRFLVPLYAALGGLAWLLCGPSFALRLTPVAFLVTLIVVRQIYRGFNIERPLSLPPEAVGGDQSWFNAMAVIALLLTVLAVFAVKLLASAWECVGVVAVLLLSEWLQNRSRGDQTSLRASR